MKMQKNQYCDVANIETCSFKVKYCVLKEIDGQMHWNGKTEKDLFEVAGDKCLPINPTLNQK